MLDAAACSAFTLGPPRASLKALADLPACWSSKAIGEACRVFITPSERLRMKTSSSLVPLPARPPLVAGPRQLCMTFETPVLLATPPEQRATATQALAAVLMQAASLDDPKADDVQP